MPYLTSIERLAKEEGREEGRQEGREEGREETLKRCIKSLMNRRFGTPAISLFPQIEAIHDRELLEKVFDQASVVATLEELSQTWE